MLACRLVPLTFETILFGLTLAALPRRTSAIFNRSVVGILIRDGIWAFAIIFCESKIYLCSMAHVPLTIRTVVLAANVAISALGNSLGASTEALVTISFWYVRCRGSNNLIHCMLTGNQLVLRYHVILGTL